MVCVRSTLNKASSEFAAVVERVEWWKSIVQHAGVLVMDVVQHSSAADPATFIVCIVTDTPLSVLSTRNLPTAEWWTQYSSFGVGYSFLISRLAQLLYAEVAFLPSRTLNLAQSNQN
jgi:hypothetical protein